MSLLIAALLAAGPIPAASRARYDNCIERAIQTGAASRMATPEVVGQAMASCSGLFDAAAQEMVQDAAAVGSLPSGLSPEEKEKLGKRELTSWTQYMSVRRVAALRTKK
jgi:hypothetical protein